MANLEVKKVERCRPHVLHLFYYFYFRVPQVTMMVNSWQMGVS